MRIVKEDQNVMVLEDRNITAFIIGIIFALAGVVVIIKPDFFTNQLPLWSGFVGILVGVFVVAVAKITTIKLDKSINKLSFLQKGLIGQSNQEYDLDQIKDVELLANYNVSRKGGGYSYDLVFVFNNGKIVPFPCSKLIIRAWGRQINPEKTLGARIAGFLGVPFQERSLPTISETISAISSAIQDAAGKEIEKQK